MSSTVSKTSTPLSKSDLTPEQSLAIDRLYNHNQTMLIGKMGFGKCIVALTAAQELLAEKHLHCVLVAAPLPVCRLTWGPEADKWEHITEPVTIVCGSVAQREKAMLHHSRIVVVNLENLRWMLQEHGTLFDGFIVDELSKLKSPGGAVLRKLRHWVSKLTWRVGMTGTPVADSGTALYAQARILDDGAALGTRSDAFKMKYFYPTDYHRRYWQLQEGAGERLAADLSALVYVPDQQSYEDSLPEVKEQTIYFKLAPQGRVIYNAIEKHHVWEGIAYDSAGLRTLKLQQLGAGGLYGDDKELIYFDEERHADQADILRSFESPVVAVYQYTFQLEYFRKRFPDALILGAGTKVTAADLARWDAGEIAHIFMHPLSAAHGLNLQYGSHILMHLSPIWSADSTAQCLARIRRRGQPSDFVERIMCLTPDTQDMKMVDRVASKGEVEGELMDQLGGVS